MGSHSLRDGFANHFTIANIPFGIATSTQHRLPAVVTRLYDDVYFLSDLVTKDVLRGLNDEIIETFRQPSLNAFAALPKRVHSDVRSKLQHIFSHHLNGTKNPTAVETLQSCANALNSLQMHLPVSVGDFSDFSCSRDHVWNVSGAVTGVSSIPPGFMHFPVGYTGRSSSIVPSNTTIRRPYGQYKSRETGKVVFGLSKAMDFELEIAAVIGKDTLLGERVKIAEADEYIFGFVLLNDWSARDIQGLEMNPLGPFNGKSVGTTLSPWVVTIEALQAFECAGPSHDIPVASYLEDPKKKPTYAIQLQVDFMASGTSQQNTICKSRVEWLYWNFRDMIAHQTVNGCPLRVGDLIATGTVSGPADGTYGCLLEITNGGKQPLKLQDGTTRAYLEDGDAVQLTGWAGELGSDQCIGFGEAYGVLAGAVKYA